MRNEKRVDTNSPSLPQRRTRRPVVESVTPPDTSDAEQSASESEEQTSKVQTVQVYKGNDFGKAKKLCTKDPKGYQFLFHKSEEGPSKNMKTTIYKCTAAGCPCEMKMTRPIQSKRSAKATVVVTRTKDHKQKGETVEHLPLGSKNFRWDSDQTKFMSNFVRIHKDITPSVLRQELKRKKMDNGAQLNQVYFLSPYFCSYTRRHRTTARYR